MARKLRDEFKIVGTRNKQGFQEKESVVVVFDNTDESIAKARRVADAARAAATPPSRTSTQTQSVADVIVIIGPDYKD